MAIDSTCQQRATGGRKWRSGVLALATLVVLAGSASGATATAGPAASATSSNATAFATVGDAVITQQDFDAAFAQAARSKFYHGKPPEDAVAQLQRDVGQALVDEVLLAQEARRRKLQPDHAAVQQTIQGYEERYRTSEQWQNNRARLLPGLQAKLERDSLLEQLTREVKHAGQPAAGQLEQYWRTHQDKFTEPEQVHLSMILLKVDPASPQVQWDGARAEAAAVVKRLRAGADFAQLAQLHSTDGSAQRGGDLGYVHRGMLPEPAQQAVDQLQPGDISEAVVMLEGIAVFRLEGRKPARLNPLDAVRARALELWTREQGEQAWTALVARLRLDTPVRLDDSRFLPLASAGQGGDQHAPR